MTAGATSFAESGGDRELIDKLTKSFATLDEWRNRCASRPARE